MKRIPEAEELMDEPRQALAYAEADFSASNELFIQLFKQLHPEEFTGRALDLGCGPADIPIRFARRHPQATIDALDGARAMLDLARQAIDNNNLQQHINLHCQHLPATTLDGRYDVLLSNSLLHHLSNPADLWQTLRNLAKPGATVLIMDLLRPESPAQVDALVTEYASGAPKVLRRDFEASLYAAYTLEEVQQQLAAMALQGLQVQQVSDRHLAVQGIIEKPPLSPTISPMGEGVIRCD
ncbi:MAG TPA: methyltransferase domain-containing protein [Thiolapillus brandeum]|uniref:Methyltransferase domain-containing protein n=1 Tax=Thiolapillus brandeum TaxID=1076588 RepID=A0A831NYU4_9GAMM|nr:methyltransferase domain-containing protein [Thiolapillus brandeum]